MNNPLSYVDSSGEIFWFVAAGAIVGAYALTSANEGALNPSKWAWDSGTYTSLAAGAIVGGLGGAILGTGGSLAMGVNVAGQNISLATLTVGAQGFSIGGGAALGGYAVANSIDWSNVDAARADEIFTSQNRHKFNNPYPNAHVDIGEIMMLNTFSFQSNSIIDPLIIDDNNGALNHYLNGDGSSVQLGQKTINLAINNTVFQYRHNRIINGLTTSKSGNFSIDMEFDMFHVGSTNVNYSLYCSELFCTVKYDLFVNDGFWDPNYINEFTLGKLGFNRYKTDGMNPNLELPGGHPYPYYPTTLIYNFLNPGYKY